MKLESVSIGTAGWSIPRALSSRFPGDGSHLQRYSSLLSCAEINSSFYRDHAFTTYERWAAGTPKNFSFSVKVPQVITHELGLRRARLPLQRFLGQVAGLGKKLGPLLIQLPPSLAFSAPTLRAFLKVLREEYDGPVVCEPRHASWFDAKAEAQFIEYRIGRVGADPSRIEAAHLPGGWYAPVRRHRHAVAYFRLHGSPRKYWSRYEPQTLKEWAAVIAGLCHRTRAWCVFDNTASGAALANALEMRTLLVNR